jgi:hypothetical protein
MAECPRLMGTLISVSRQVSAKLGTGTVVGLNGTLVEAKMFTFTQESKHIFNKCRILTHARLPNLALVYTERITV